MKTSAGIMDHEKTMRKNTGENVFSILSREYNIHSIMSVVTFPTSIPSYLCTLLNDY